MASLSRLISFSAPSCLSEASSMDDDVELMRMIGRDTMAFALSAIRVSHPLPQQAFVMLMPWLFKKSFTSSPNLCMLMGIGVI